MWSGWHFPLAEEECLSVWKATSFRGSVGPGQNSQLDLGPKPFFEIWHHKHSFLEDTSESVAYCYMLHTGTKQTLNCFPLWGFKKKFSLLLWQNVWGECAEEEEEEEPKKMLSAYSKREPSPVCKLLVKTSRQSPASHWMPSPLLFPQPKEQQSDLTCLGAG